MYIGIQTILQKYYITLAFEYQHTYLIMEPCDDVLIFAKLSFLIMQTKLTDIDASFPYIFAPFDRSIMSKCTVI